MKNSKKFQVVEISFGEENVISENLSYTAAKNLAFESAKKEADLYSGDWQYSFETNNSSIYFHSNDRHGVKKELVARRGYDECEVRDYKFVVREQK